MRKRRSVSRKNTTAVPVHGWTPAQNRGRVTKMFQTGAFIVYGNIGVCKVTGIAAPDFPDVDKSQLYYTLKPLYQNGMIYTPVNTKVFMRPIITAGEAQRLIDMIPSIRVEAYHSRFF